MTLASLSVCRKLNDQIYGQVSHEVWGRIGDRVENAVDATITLRSRNMITGEADE